MASSARQAIACVLFIFIAAVCAQSQVAPVKTATISGNVTLKNKGLAGVVVVANHSDYSSDRSSYRATTDQTGKYRITNVVPGTYQIGPLSRGLVYEDQMFKRSLVIAEGDNVEDVDFSMSRGGVITGKITDAEGRPMVEEMVFLQPVDGPYAITPYFNGGIMTDDRGVYRAFALHAGKYKVYVGQGSDRLPGGTRVHRQTFYPSVTDSAKATVVEVIEGGEVSDIDIMMGRALSTYRVTGRIVDGETGKPVSHLRYGIFEFRGGMGSSSSGASTNADGEFKFEGVLPGKYSVFIDPEQNTGMRADPVPFEVVDSDLTGLVVKTVKGSSVSGVVVMEGVEDPAALAKIGTVFVHGMYEQREGQFDEGVFSDVKPDGTFRINGLPAGVLNFAVSAHGPGVTKQMALVRIERDGILQPNGVTVKDGEQITGLRLTMKTLAATIHGQVKVEDGELPANARLSIWIDTMDESRSLYRVTSGDSSPRIDSRGRFLIEGLAGGTYQINIAVFEEGRSDSNRIFKQQVTITDNSVNDVTMTIKLKP